MRAATLARRGLGAALLGLASLFPRPTAAQHPLVTLPIDDPAYAQLDALERAGCRSARVGPYRPYAVRDVRRAVSAAMNEPTCPALLVDALQRRFLPDTAAAPDSSRLLLGERERIALDSLARIDSARAAARVGGAGPDTIGARPGIDAGGALTIRATALGSDEFRPLWRDLRPSGEGDPAVVAIARGRVRWSAGPRFVAVSEVYLQSSRRNDPTVRAKRLRGAEGFMDVGEAYLNGRLGPIDVSFGRSAEAWLGDGRESLVLSAQGPLMDRLMLSGRWSHVQARSLVAVLNDVTVTEALDSLAPGTGSVRFHRAFAAHALTWTPVSGLELTLGETMLFARRGAALDLAYYNPVVPFIVAQNDTSRAGAEGRDNLTVFGGLRGQLGPAVVEGELLVDDIQVDAADRARTASQLAWRTKASAALPFAQPTIASLEYRRIGSFTYSRGLYSEVYQQYDAPLGSELGPDADMLTGELARWPNGVLRLAVGGSLWRHGATRLERRPSESPNFHGGEPFPSVRTDRPAVQRGLIGYASVRTFTTWLPITARAELARIENANNLPSAAALYLRLNVIGSYALRFP